MHREEYSVVPRRAHLAEAERHIEDGEREVSAVRDEVGRLERDGYPAEGARNLLKILEATLKTMVEYRRIVFAEIAAGKR